MARWFHAKGVAALVALMVAAAGLVSPARGQADAGHPDAIWIDGTIYTMDPANPRVDALAVTNGRVSALGTKDEIRRLAGPRTRTMSLRNQWMLPGMIDCHVNLMALGLLGIGQIDLSEARSFEEIVELVKATAPQVPQDRWVLGGRWDSRSWAIQELPGNNTLTEAIPNRPVWLRRADGRAGIANLFALKLAGINRDTPDPPGGEIVRDENGEPTGVLLGGAVELVNAITRTTEVTTERLLLRAQDRCIGAGLTTVHFAGATAEELESLRSLEGEGKLKLRVYAMARASDAAGWMGAHGPVVGDRLTVRAVFGELDGTLNRREAWLLQPYSDRPTGPDGAPNLGVAITPVEQIRSLATIAADKGYQFCLGATGDRAVREALDVFTGSLAGRDAKAARWRVEHATVTEAADAPRFAELGVVASIQPDRCPSEMKFIEQRLGAERAARAFPWKLLADSGARLAAGSDLVHDPLNPMNGIHAAITRQDRFGNPKAGFHREQALSREQALKAFTIDAAYAGFEESLKGSLSVGKLADFIVIDKDIMNCPEQDIASIKVLLTMVGGELLGRGSREASASDEK